MQKMLEGRYGAWESIIRIEYSRAYLTLKWITREERDEQCRSEKRKQLEWNPWESYQIGDSDS